MIGTGFLGYTHPDGSVVDLYPDSYKISTYGSPKDSVTCEIFEDEARLSEKYWWELYKSKNGGF